MKFYLAILALIGFTNANNCGSAPLGSLGRRLDLEDFGHNRQQGAYGTGNRPNSPRRGGNDSRRPQGYGNAGYNAQTPQNSNSNQNSRGTNYACFPTPSSPVQFVQARPTVARPPGTVIVTVSQNQAPQHFAPVSQSYVQTAFFPTVDFYPWGNTVNRFTSAPTTSTQPTVPTPVTPVTPVTPTPTPSTSLPLPQPQPILNETQTTVTQPPSTTVPQLPAVVPLPAVQEPALPAQPQNQGFELSSTYLFNQNNPNVQLNLTSSEPTQTTQSTEVPAIPVPNVLLTDTIQPADATSTQVISSEEATAPASVPDFSEFDFTNFDFDNLDTLLNAPVATPVPAQTPAA